MEYPTLPDRAASAAELVPEGWVVEEEIAGDLNADGSDDVTLVLRMNDPKNVVENEDLGADRLDTNPRMLVVAFADPEAEGLALALADHTLIPRHTDPVMEDPFGGVEVSRGSLRVLVGLWMSAGGWSTTNTKLTFRHQDGCFRLIGYDGTEMQRNTGRLSQVSVNYLTRKAQRKWGYSDEAMNETWEEVPEAKLPCLEEVGDALEFTPGLAPRSERAEEMLEAAAKKEPEWSTRVAEMKLGSGAESVTLKGVRATCGEDPLREALATTAAELSACLSEGKTAHVTAAFADGRVATRVEPEDEASYCVVEAMDRAHFDDLQCVFDARVSVGP
ncbi:MAG: hypothetical protein ACQGVC_15000 [Myxococcota bacterium]